MITGKQPTAYCLLAILSPECYDYIGMFDSLTTAISSLVVSIAIYIPKLLAGILILLIGVIVASLFKDLISVILRYSRVEKWMEKAGLKTTPEANVWPTMMVELVRWTTIFIFLTSAVEVWEIPKVADVIDQLLRFIPNVVLAVIIGWIGLVAARFANNIVRHGVGGLQKEESLILAGVARSLIIFFTVLIILTQLGIAADLVKILFTGIVGMLALAGGLAFGLGGQDEAREFLKRFRKRISALK